MRAAMRELPFGLVLKAALIAGVVAGLVVASFHYVATEPVIEQAIALEEQLHTGDGHGATEEPLVSRDFQRAGLFLGFLLYGTTWALLFAAVFGVAQRWLPAVSAPQRGLLLAALGYWSVALLPFLKYPANPPGVGDPDSITLRQTLYLGFLALSVASAAAAIAAGRSVSRMQAAGRSRGRAVAVAASVLMVFAAGLLLAMPGNPDPIEMPLDLVAHFRVLSLAGLTLFWTVLGATFGLLVRRERPVVP